MPHSPIRSPQLPKDPSVWTLAEEDCVAGAHHIEGAVGRFWRPEVLGCSICPTPAEVLSDLEKKRSSSGTATDGAGTPRHSDSRTGSRSSQTAAGTSAQNEGAGRWDSSAGGPDAKKPQNPKFIQMADGRGGVEKAETARVLSKALKVSSRRLRGRCDVISQLPVF